MYCFVFFFQAEDGIRGGHVTGVQTCALPISSEARPSPMRAGTTSTAAAVLVVPARIGLGRASLVAAVVALAAILAGPRSEERRVGKEGRSGGSPTDSQSRTETSTLFLHGSN